MTPAWGLAAGVITVVLMLLFIGIWIWAWRPRHRQKFDAMARLPMNDSPSAANHAGDESR